MYADLVGAARFRKNIEQRSLTLGKALRHPPHRTCLARRRSPNRHAFAVPRVATNGSVHLSLIRARHSSHHSSIRALDRMPMELLGEMAMGVVGFCGHDHTRRPLVQTVHDSRSLYSTDTREVSTMVEQGIDEGSARVAGAGVHDHPRRLADDDQFVVLVQNLEGYLLRLDR